MCGLSYSQDSKWTAVPRTGRVSVVSELLVTCGGRRGTVKKDPCGKGSLREQTQTGTLYPPRTDDVCVHPPTRIKCVQTVEVSVLRL